MSKSLMILAQTHYPLEVENPYNIAAWWNYDYLIANGLTHYRSVQCVTIHTNAFTLGKPSYDPYMPSL